MREDVHATRQLHCQWWFGQCHAKHAANAASVHQCCASATDRPAAGRRPVSCRPRLLERVEVWTVLWHRSGGMKAGVACSRTPLVSDCQNSNL